VRLVHNSKKPEFSGAINMKATNRLPWFCSPAFLVALLAAMAVGSAGCGKSDATDSGRTDGSSAQISDVERAAQDFALAEVRKHWIKAPEGWITARDTGSSFAPIRFLRQLRELAVEDVSEDELSESDRLNGFEWAGEVSFKSAPCREAGEPGIMLDGMVMGATIFRQRGRWTQWVEFQPEPVRVQKVKGKWQVHQDTWLLRGKPPGSQDFANAGVR
jgi:hypothetical protein